MNSNEIDSLLPMEMESPTAAPPTELARPLDGPQPQLAGRRPPFYVVQQERPAHRAALEMAAQGYDVKEIAAKLGYTPVAVNNWLRQPHAQQTLVDTIHKNIQADERVVEIVKDNVVAACELYAQVLADKNAPLEKRMEAAERFLNRRYGKPNQPINRGTDVDG